MSIHIGIIVIKLHNIRYFKAQVYALIIMLLKCAVKCKYHCGNIEDGFEDSDQGDVFARRTVRQRLHQVHRGNDTQTRSQHLTEKQVWKTESNNNSNNIIHTLKSNVVLCTEVFTI